jgi:hypothetical protein
MNEDKDDNIKRSDKNASDTLLKKNENWAFCARHGPYPRGGFCARCAKEQRSRGSSSASD